MELYDNYLMRHYEGDIGSMLASDLSEGSYTIFVDMYHLQHEAPELFKRLQEDAWEERRKWNASLTRVQQQILHHDPFLVDSDVLRDSCSVTLHNLPASADTHFSTTFPNLEHIGKLIQVKGNVIRLSSRTYIESKREYICSKCKKSVLCHALYARTFFFSAPTRCPDAFGPNRCRGTMQPKLTQPNEMNCMDYQEFRMQELSGESRMPRTLFVTLEDDMVESCEPGDCVVVCGALQLQFLCTKEHVRPIVRLVLRAISVYSDQKRSSRKFADEALYAQLMWQEIVESDGEARAREKIVSSFSPKTLGLQCIKLAICLVLCSGDDTLPLGNVGHVRQNSHILLVGDPAMGKSKLITFAKDVAPRAIYTTGVGSTQAGLTAAAVRENNKWHLEAGALVLADGGVCCIDEFHLLSNNDKASIHECLEQQTLSLAKAGLICTRRTRCSVIAGMNPKVNPKGDTLEELEVAAIGLSSPLLSRFDLIFRMQDQYDSHWDGMISSHFMKWVVRDFVEEEEEDGLWDKTKLQAHFVMIRDIHPTMQVNAERILKEYYTLCRQTYQNVARGRTTMRLWNSLERLAKAHAKLMAHTRVTLVDAVAVIFLMESSWGYGGILPPINVINEELPYPTDEMIDQVLFALSLTREDLSGGDSEPPSETRKRSQPEDVSPVQRPEKRSTQSSATLHATQDFLRQEIAETAETSSGYKSAFMNLLSHQGESLNLELDDVDPLPERQESNGESTSTAPSSSFQLNIAELRECLDTEKDNEGTSTVKGFLADQFKDFDCADLELE
ncbi:DNA helicase MCM9-like [Phlebotomus argentipes]|uniref:DNA helicase MCM9-like n=1 Tax=Phlebotomus argentipes TaxID=94469 RepID=UPI002892C3D5|nr:DNA helicase MCM9-like [Phlebotomus argentipes]